MRVYLDEVDLQGGDRIPATIKANLRDCDEFVILLSPESLTRQWVIAEMGGAWILDKRIMAIRYDLAAESIPDILRHDKSYELNDFDRYVNELIERRKGKGKSNGRKCGVAQTRLQRVHQLWPGRSSAGG
jgi:TIR domain